MSKAKKTINQPLPPNVLTKALEAQGEKGWSPLIRAVQDGERKVLELFAWTGGDGAAPTETGYLGLTGLVTNIADGVDFQGDSYVPEFDNNYFDL